MIKHFDNLTDFNAFMQNHLQAGRILSHSYEDIDNCIGICKQFDSFHEAKLSGIDVYVNEERKNSAWKVILFYTFPNGDVKQIKICDE